MAALYRRGRVVTPAPAIFATRESVNQPRSETVPDEILELGHHEFTQRVQEIEIAPFDGTGPLLRLCVSVEVHPSKPPGPGRHRGATTVAIRMDQAAARMLFAQIRETFQRMGWPLPPEAENQAERR
jgi:hypothetical protein